MTFKLQVRQEARVLASQYGEYEDFEGRDVRDGSLAKTCQRAGVSKRTSLPENFAYASVPRQMALQQQLLQHRLQQKRQVALSRMIIPIYQSIHKSINQSINQCCHFPEPAEAATKPRRAALWGATQKQ